ncbi:MAG TPA: universal stress protein [Micromonosporaceae bacterium]
MEESRERDASQQARRDVLARSQGSERRDEALLRYVTTATHEYKAEAAMTEPPSTTAEHTPIVVGIDGSEPSLAAARWGAAEARRRHLPLRLVHAYRWPFVAASPAAPPVGWSEATLRQDAEALVAAAVRAVVADAGEVPVAGRAIEGPTAAVLVKASAQACLVVLGHRSRGGIASLLLGSVAAAVCAHAHGPVVVVRQTLDATRPTEPIVVGVDGSPGGDRAIGFAFAEADLRGLPLIVAHAWNPPSRGEVAPFSDSVAELETAELHQMREWVHLWQEKFQHVPVSHRLIAAHPALALIDLSRHATLLVIGSRGRGGFTGLLLGSVSQQALHHAHCPVAIIR